eukprot:1640149-Amphidinium_carterae.1
MQHDTHACIGALNELYGNPAHFEAGERQNRLSAAQKMVVNHVGHSVRLLGGAYDKPAEALQALRLSSGD